MSDEFIREVDEEVRQERYERLWKRYGRFVVAGAVAIVLAAIAGVLWQNYQQQRREADSRAFIQAITLANQDHAEEAINLLGALVTDGSAGYALLAKLREAGLLVHSGDVEAAIIVYKRIAEDGSVQQVYRDYAMLMAVLNEIDTIDPDDADTRLASLMADGNAWRFSARELVAIAAMRADRKDRARELLEINADDPQAPQGIRGRAAQLLAILDA